MANDIVEREHTVHYPVFISKSDIKIEVMHIYTDEH